MNKNLSEYELAKAALEIRLDLLNLCKKEVIHIGGDLSVADIMTVLWQYQMCYNPLNPDDENRDRFILSKSHASAVTSFNQAKIGCFPSSDVINEYATDFGRFSMHSCNKMNKFVEFSTGSLGHGLPVACGIAAALRIKSNNRSRVYTIMGDGEQSEGSIWESVVNAAKYKLGNLIAIVDNNNLEADGYVDQITGYKNFAELYDCLGWNVFEIDGHDIHQIKMTFDNLPEVSSNKPTVIIAHTIKGKGVEFMENNPKWHAGKINQEQYEDSTKKLIMEFEQRWKAL